MATSTVKDRFDAAVKVIHSLPKNGPFQPSYEMMLSFYAYYKQGTEGPCKKPKPWAWDVVAKKKWDAWTKLGDMPREKAMELYVEDLKKNIKSCTAQWNEMSKNGKVDERIVEAMPQNDKVRDFMSQLGDFYEIVEDKPPFADELAKHNGSLSLDADADYSQSDRSYSDQENEDEQLVKNHSMLVEKMIQQKTGHESNGNAQKGNGVLVVNGKGHGALTNGERLESESDEEFCDTSDQPSQDSDLSGPHGDHSVSTPLNKSTLKPVNHVHFNESMTIHTDSEVYEQTIPSVAKTQLNFNQNFMTSLGNVKDRSQISDSLIVQGSSAENTLDLTDSVNFGETERSFSNQSESSYSEMDSPTLHNRNAERSRNPSKSSSQSYPSGKSTDQGARPKTSLSREFDSHNTVSSRKNVSNLQSNAEVDEQIMNTLRRLQQDMNSVLTRLNNIESAQQIQGGRPNKKSVWTSNWWPFPSLTGKTFFFVLIWPIIVNWLLYRMFRRRRQNR